MRRTNMVSDVSNLQIEKEFRRTILKQKRWATVRRTTSLVIVFSAMIVLATTWWLPIYQITGDSMEPTLERGTIVVARNIDNYKLGDIVAVHYGNRIVINRLIGAPGDRIHMDEHGTISINDIPLQEDYLSAPSPGMTDLAYPFQVPDGCYFIMGDNRERAMDSRMSEIGCVEETAFAGKVFYSIWPLHRIGYVG